MEEKEICVHRLRRSPRFFNHDELLNLDKSHPEFSDEWKQVYPPIEQELSDELTSGN